MLSVSLMILVSGCEKFLDEKPDKSLAVPHTLKDLQALLDQYPLINHNDPSAGEVSADDYYLTDADWAARKETDQNMYLWQKHNLFDIAINDWFRTFRPVYFSNTALENIPGIPVTQFNRDEWNNVKGQALFYRAKAFLQASFIWTVAYDENSAASDQGLPLRLNSDFNEVSVRSDLKATYTQIIADLKEAVRTLALKPVHVIRPSKPAAYGLLARVYLAMRKYEQAGLYADSCLKLKPDLLDYNTLNPSATYPVPQFNAEVIFESYFPPAPPVSNNRAKIVPELYQMYAPNDLRKVVFFRTNTDGSRAFKGSYDPNGALFSGVASDEMYLIRAECFARAGKVTEAMIDLNTLLRKRWKTGTFTDFKAANTAEALNLILAERRKELLMRGLRWMDIKRLNREGGGIILSRTINGKTYTLQPNDPRYALSIPEEIIELSKMVQNP